MISIVFGLITRRELRQDCMCVQSGPHKRIRERQSACVRRWTIDNGVGLRQSGVIAKPALGRGLGALLGGSPIAKPPSPVSISNIIAEAASAIIFEIETEIGRAHV